MIKIDFQFETDYGVYRDALYLPDDHNLTDEQILALQLERRDNWLAIVTPSPVAQSAPETIEIDGVLYVKAPVNGS